MESIRVSSRLSPLVFAALALVTGAGFSTAQVVVKALPKGISIEMAGAIGPSGSAGLSNPATIIPSEDFARILSFQMVPIPLSPTARPANGPANNLTVRLQGALQEQVKSGTPFSQAVLVQGVLVQALMDSKTLDDVAGHLGVTYHPPNPTAGLSAAKQLAKMHLALQNRSAQKELELYGANLNQVLSSSLAGDERRASSLFDDLVSQPIGKSATKEDSAELREARFNLLPDVPDHPGYPTLLQQIATLMPTFEAAMRRVDCSLTSGFCRAGSGTLKKMLAEKGVKKIKVMANMGHTFLIIPAYFSKGDPLVIDPTYRQFIDRTNWEQAPKIYVGTKAGLLQVLRGYSVADYRVQSYFQNLRDDSGAPDVRLPP